jgi:uncharacterized membrane protein YhaH (DUF805 family)
MNWRQFLFSFNGRVGRKQYWLMVLLTVPFIVAAALINGGLEHYPTDRPGVLVLLPIVWPAFAVTIKRWHDRNKSGWWVLINFVPVVGDIWSLIENGFLKGTPGDNRFGSDPLAGSPGRP